MEENGLVCPAGHPLLDKVNQPGYVYAIPMFKIERDPTEGQNVLYPVDTAFVADLYRCQICGQIVLTDSKEYY